MSTPRLLDVAHAAGVSLRTASRVLNGDHRVAEPTRQRVHDAMRTLRFEPDAMARSLRAGTDTAVALVVESVADPFFAEVADAVEEAMAEEGRAVLVASTRRDPAQEQAVLRRMLQRRVAGLLVVPSDNGSGWMSEASVPVVLIDRGVPGGVADLVDIDDRRAAFDAVSHLVEHGHRAIAYVGDTSAIPTSAARLQGYLDALDAHGLPRRPELVAATGTTTAAAAQVTHALLDAAEQGTHVSAIFSATTRASLGVVPALHASRRTDLALVALGDFAMADALEPGVTVVDHSGTRLGRAAADRLVRRLADPALPVGHVRLDTPLITRGSGELRP